MRPLVDRYGVYWVWDWSRDQYTAIFPTGQVWSYEDAIERGDVRAELFEESK